MKKTKGCDPMFFSGKERLAMKRAAQAKNEREGLDRYELPMFVRDEHGNTTRHFGDLSAFGCSYKTNHSPDVGQILDLKLVLIGMGTEIRMRGRVTEVTSHQAHQVVYLRFEPMHPNTLRQITNWLRLVSTACKTAPAA